MPARLRKLGMARLIRLGLLLELPPFWYEILGYFDRKKMEYLKTPIKEQVEVLSLTGNITHSEAGYKVHAHAVLGRADASTLGGHILEAHIWPTLEVIVEESPKHLICQTDPETGLPLLDFRNA